MADSRQVTSRNASPRPSEESCPASASRVSSSSGGQKFQCEFSEQYIRGGSNLSGRWHRGQVNKVTSLRPQSNIVNSVQTEEIYSDLGHTVDEDLTHAGPALTLDPGTNNSMKDVFLCLVSTSEPTQDGIDIKNIRIASASELLSKCQGEP